MEQVTKLQEQPSKILQALSFGVQKFQEINIQNRKKRGGLMINQNKLIGQ